MSLMSCFFTMKGIKLCTVVLLLLINLDCTINLFGTVLGVNHVLHKEDTEYGIRLSCWANDTLRGALSLKLNASK